MSDGGDSPALDFLSNIPLETAGAPQSIPGLPLSVSEDFFRALVQFPSKSSDGTSLPVSARIPPEVMEAISVLRDWCKTQFPARTIWPTVSDFMRSAIMHFIFTVSKVKASYESGEDPETSSSGLIEAMLFNERTGARLEARAQTKKLARQRAWNIARDIRDMMNMGEVADAADEISEYVEDINSMRYSGTGFWERYFVRILFAIPSVAEDAQTLINGNIIVDTAIIDTIQHVLELVESGDIIIGDERPDNITDMLPLPTQEEIVGDA